MPVSESSPAILYLLVQWFRSQPLKIKKYRPPSWRYCLTSLKNNLSFDNVPPPGVQRFLSSFLHLLEASMFRTDHHRCFHQRNHLSQCSPAASPPNVIRISTRKRFKVFRCPRILFEKANQYQNIKNALRQTQILGSRFTHKTLLWPVLQWSFARRVPSGSPLHSLVWGPDLQNAVTAAKRRLAEADIKECRFDNMRRLSNSWCEIMYHFLPLLVVYPFSPVSSLTTFAWDSFSFPRTNQNPLSWVQ